MSGPIEIGNFISFTYQVEPKKTKKIHEPIEQKPKFDRFGRKIQQQPQYQVKKVVTPEIHEKYPECFVLHDNWRGNVHCLLTKNYSQREINYLTALIDPFFAEEESKKNAELRAQLQRVPQDANIVSPHAFYLNIIKPFIHLYDGYRKYNPQKMLNVRVIKPYKDIEMKMRSTQKTTTGQEKDHTGKGTVAGAGYALKTNFFDQYRKTLGRMRGPKL